MELRGIERELLKRANKHNNERSGEATAALGVGLLNTVIMTAAAFGFWWLAMHRTQLAFFGVDAHVWLTGFSLFVAFAEAFWNRNPFAGLKPLGSSDLQMDGGISYYGMARSNDRQDHVAASGMELFISGPRSIMAGIGLLFGGLPTSGAAAREGARALVTLAKGGSTEITHKGAGRLLVGLRLAGRSNDPDRPVFFPTNRAAFVVREHAGTG